MAIPLFAPTGALVRFLRLCSWSTRFLVLCVVGRAGFERPKVHKMGPIQCGVERIVTKGPASVGHTA
jgi:hypothetical protein